MGYHHVAMATTDLEASHRFYTEVMGFELVKTVVAPTGSPGGGWAKHVFYDTGGGELFALWDLHDPDIEPGYATALSRGLGLPEWVNHIAFAAATLDELAARCRRWQEHGIEVVEIDHEFCRSIYATDPGGTLVEFSCTTVAFTADDAAEAQRQLDDPAPALGEMPEMTFHPALLPATPPA